MTPDRQRRIEGCRFLAPSPSCIPAANWLIGHAGTVCVPNGPCLIPVAPGVDGASRRADDRPGAGAARPGAAAARRRWALGAILAGAALSACRAAGAGASPRPWPSCCPSWRTSPSTRRCSAPAGAGGRGLQRWSAWWSTASCSCGSPSAAWTTCSGQVVGKAWMVLLALPLVHLLRRRDERLGLVPA